VQVTIWWVLNNFKKQLENANKLQPARPEREDMTIGTMLKLKLLKIMELVIMDGLKRQSQLTSYSKIWRCLNMVMH